MVEKDTSLTRREFSKSVIAYVVATLPIVPLVDNLSEYREKMPELRNTLIFDLPQQNEFTEALDDIYGNGFSAALAENLQAPESKDYIADNPGVGELLRLTDMYLRHGDEVTKIWVNKCKEIGFTGIPAREILDDCIDNVSSNSVNDNPPTIRITGEINVEKVSQKLHLYPQNIINMSWQPGEIGFEISRGSGGLKVKFIEAYPSDNPQKTKESLDKLFWLRHQHPEKYFLTSAGNYSADLGKVLPEFGKNIPLNGSLIAQINEWRKIGGVYDSFPFPVFGADIYEPNNLDHLNNGSSYGIPLITAASAGIFYYYRDDYEQMNNVLSLWFANERIVKYSQRIEKVNVFNWQLAKESFLKATNY